MKTVKKIYKTVWIRLDKCILFASVAFPESPRWLTVQRRYDEVTTLLHRMCKTNGRQLPPDFHPTWLIDEVTIGCYVLCENYY